MRGVGLHFFFVLAFFATAFSVSLASAQQDTFRWVDFHSPKDQDVVIWVTRSLEAEKWTSIREIGVIYDAVLTSLRSSMTGLSISGMRTGCAAGRQCRSGRQTRRRE